MRERREGESGYPQAQIRIVNWNLLWSNSKHLLNLLRDYPFVDGGFLAAQSVAVSQQETSAYISDYGKTKDETTFSLYYAKQAEDCTNNINPTSIHSIDSYPISVICNNVR